MTSRISAEAASPRANYMFIYWRKFQNSHKWRDNSYLCQDFWKILQLLASECRLRSDLVLMGHNWANPLSTGPTFLYQILCLLWLRGMVVVPSPSSRNKKTDIITQDSPHFLLQGQFVQLQIQLVRHFDHLDDFDQQLPMRQYLVHSLHFEKTRTHTCGEEQYVLRRVYVIVESTYCVKDEMRLCTWWEINQYGFAPRSQGQLVV